MVIELDGAGKFIKHSSLVDREYCRIREHTSYYLTVVPL